MTESVPRRKPEPSGIVHPGENTGRPGRSGGFIRSTRKDNVNQERQRDILVRGKGLGARRGGRWLVRDVNISIGRGEIVTLIGPNGSGKSTLARLITGVLSPDAGSVERAPGLRIGYVPQKLDVDRTFPLDVGRMMNLTQHHSRARIVAALEMAGIAHLEGMQVHDLSGGEFQRALLARAIICAPDLLVLDEPVQGVDFSGQAELYRLIGNIRETTGCGVLLISHDLHIVMAQSDEVICLNTHVCCSGSPELVSASAPYRALFGPRADQTHALYRHDHDHCHLPDGSIVPETGTGKTKETGHAG